VKREHGTPRPLSAEAFADSGNVIEAGDNAMEINQGTTLWFHHPAGGRRE